MADDKQFYSKPFIVFCWLIAAVGGLMFGYDIEISGGVTAMDDFLLQFSQLYMQRNGLQEKTTTANSMINVFNCSHLHCTSLHLSRVCFASKVCTKYGRKQTTLVASGFYLIGVALNAAANNLIMLIVGRILLGFGVGFGNEAVPVFLSEIAPLNYRGAVNILFQLFVTIGILCANLVNFFVSEYHPWGWRLALGLAGVPAFMLFLGSFVIPDTPTSLIERGQLQNGRSILQKIRRTEEIENEYNQIVHASELAHQVKNPFKKLAQPSSRPPLVIGMLMQVFQQFTGINAIMFYAPVLFQTVGFKNDASLLSSVIIGLVNVFSTLVSIKTVDKFGRRALLLQACCQMFITQTVIGIILLSDLKSTGSLGHIEAIVVVLLVCLFVMSFAWSWGPLGWLIPSETFPLETRTPVLHLQLVQTCSSLSS
ncbi:hypothetical protein C5167_048999 [Papaver somniferum]|uniref:Major facilitator superfamily (MFS) profile domain-containing protein n=1 Tax=Papaver somniferum TaxID=3469 RepID=A0A4Y7KN44_PAPSO|nr:hypothetical protein C5167_048999 [Papaver somniferum]